MKKFIYKLQLMEKLRQQEVDYKNRKSDFKYFAIIFGTWGIWLLAIIGCLIYLFKKFFV